MDFKIYRCLKCHWHKETDEHDLKCPICNSDLQVEISDEAEDDVIIKQMTERELGIMKYNIKTYGNKEVWRVMENIKEPLARLNERSIFIKAGGRIPEKEIKI